MSDPKPMRPHVGPPEEGAWGEQPERRGSSRHGGPPLSVTGVRGTVHDVSRGGVCLVLEEPVEWGVRYALVLRNAVDGSTQEVEAEAVWRSGDCTGFRWVELTPEQDRWLLHCFRAWLRSVASPLGH